MKTLIAIMLFSLFSYAQITGDAPAVNPNDDIHSPVESEETIVIQKSKTPPESDPNLNQTNKKTEAHKKAEHHEVSPGVSAEQAFTFLKNGNVRFKKGYLRKDGASRSDIKRLSTGQKPHAIVLSCSDSRVPPEVVFDQKLGEIFVVRTAGEALDPTSIASIEYAIEHLGSKLLVVMGHTQCGAVKAALSTLDGKDAGSDNLNKLVADIHPRIKKFANKSHSKDYSVESWANVSGVAKDLISRSTIIAEKINSGEIQIKEALYHLDSGEVKWQ